VGVQSNGDKTKLPVMFNVRFRNLYFRRQDDVLPRTIGNQQVTVEKLTDGKTNAWYDKTGASKGTPGDAKRVTEIPGKGTKIRKMGSGRIFLFVST